jgi:hypothetical protein
MGGGAVGARAKPGAAAEARGESGGCGMRREGWGTVGPRMPMGCVYCSGLFLALTALFPTCPCLTLDVWMSRQGRCDPPRRGLRPRAPHLPRVVVGVPRQRLRRGYHLAVHLRRHSTELKAGPAEPLMELPVAASPGAGSRLQAGHERCCGRQSQRCMLLLGFRVSNAAGVLLRRGWGPSASEC